MRRREWECKRKRVNEEWRVGVEKGKKEDRWGENDCIKRKIIPEGGREKASEGRIVDMESK